jgi:ATP-dependent exoDNAse (exonuclease V) alpha subunit
VTPSSVGCKFHRVSIYHLRAKKISRVDGHGVVAAAAYRSAMSLRDESRGITHDYTRKAGVTHTEIVAPENAPEWAHNRQKLWNAVEKMERRSDAPLAREIEVGLPVELSESAQVELVRQYTKREFVSLGMIADIAIHRDDLNNPHAHILLCLRTITSNGFGHKKWAWNDREYLLAWRRGWAELANEHLAKAGIAQRIDHRSLKAQGLDRPPALKIGV